MKTALAIGGGIALIVIGLTVLGGGDFSLGTGSTGPYANFGFSGPYRKA